MPQLKKVVLAVGDRLIYEDTYEKALEQLAKFEGGTPTVTQTSTTTTGTSAGANSPPPPPPNTDARLDRVRDHLRRYREFASQGKWSEAGKELEAIEAEVRR